MSVIDGYWTSRAQTLGAYRAAYAIGYALGAKRALPCVVRAGDVPHETRVSIEYAQAGVIDGFNFGKMSHERDYSK